MDAISSSSSAVTASSSLARSGCGSRFQSPSNESHRCKTQFKYGEFSDGCITYAQVNDYFGGAQNPRDGRKTVVSLRLLSQSTASKDFGLLVLRHEIAVLVPPEKESTGAPDTGQGHRHVGNGLRGEVGDVHVLVGASDAGAAAEVGPRGVHDAVRADHGL